MKRDIFVGVDGGGTKSKLVMRDIDGNLLGQGLGGAANIRTSVDISIRSILDAFNQALSEAGLNKNDPNLKFHFGLGLAGTEVKAHCIEFLAKFPEFETISLESDAFAACLGAHNNKDGAILIVGTGVIAYRIVGGGVKRIAGWGFPHDDVGGGAWLGLQATRYALHWKDGRKEYSPLLKAIFKHFDNDLMHLVAWANQANATEYATLAPFVIEHLAQQDPWALHIVEMAGSAISEVARAILLDQPKLPLCLFGGLAPFLQPFIAQDIQQHIVDRKEDAPEGAIMMIQNALNCEAGTYGQYAS